MGSGGRTGRSMEELVERAVAGTDALLRALEKEADGMLALRVMRERRRFEAVRHEAMEAARRFDGVLGFETAVLEALGAGGRALRLRMERRLGVKCGSGSAVARVRRGSSRGQAGGGE